MLPAAGKDRLHASIGLATIQRIHLRVPRLRAGHQAAVRQPRSQRFLIASELRREARHERFFNALAIRREIINTRQSRGARVIKPALDASGIAKIALDASGIAKPALDASGIAKIALDGPCIANAILNRLVIASLEAHRSSIHVRGEILLPNACYSIR